MPDLKQTVRSFLSAAPARQPKPLPRFNADEHLAAIPYHPVSRRLAAVTCYFNPHGSAARRRCYATFADQFPRIGLPLYVIEGSIDDYWHTLTRWRFRLESCLFAKENLLNLAIARLPDRFDRVLWIDCDILLVTPGYVERLVDAMDRHTVVQGYQYLRYIGPNGEPDTDWRCGVVARNDEQSTHHGHPSKAYPGGAWAASRDLLASVGGLYDRCITGGGDVAWSTAVYADADAVAARPYWSRPLVDAVLDYGRKVSALVSSVGHVSSRALHLYHGQRVNRQYTDRHRVTVDTGYDPARHLEYADNGTLRWSREAPAALRRGVRDYIFGRKEDLLAGDQHLAATK